MLDLHEADFDQRIARGTFVVWTFPPSGARPAAC